MATRTVSKCACGKRMSQYSRECKKCYEVNRAKTIRQNQEIVATGKCPQCGAGFRRNLAMTGWVQCEQFGDGHFRKDQSKPSCSFQCFIV